MLWLCEDGRQKTAMLGKPDSIEPQKQTTSVDENSITQPKVENITDRDNTCYSLDELLSPKALGLLNKQGYVCFKIQDDNGYMRGGWISRQVGTETRTFVEREAVTFNTNMDPT